MKIIKYDINDFSDIVSMYDFYERIGLYDSETNKWEIDKVSQVHMRRGNDFKLLDFISANKDSKKKMSQKLRKISDGMEWLMLCPVGNLIVPENEIWIYGEEECKNI